MEGDFFVSIPKVYSLGRSILERHEWRVLSWGAYGYDLHDGEAKAVVASKSGEQIADLQDVRYVIFKIKTARRDILISGNVTGV